MEQQYVIFDLADEHYGIDIASVESIIKLQPITFVPKAPDFIEGIINLRGEVLPVIDLRKRFGLASQDESSESRIIVVEVDEQHVGMIVDAVTEVMILETESVQTPPALLIGDGVDFITGIGRVADQLVTIIDLRKVLLSDELPKLEKITAPTP